MKCNLCGCSKFGDMGTRTNAKCSGCGSLERTRLLWLYLERMAITSDTRILHIAPEKGLYSHLKNLTNQYVAADLSPKRFSFANCVKIDLCDLDSWASEEFDLIIHSHVFEHITCNIAYSLYHLHRMLKKDGKHLGIIPFVSGRWDECFQDVGDQERARRFGQHDHVRRFGNEDIAKHLGKLINVPSVFDATEEFSRKVLVDANIPESHWYGFQIGTVLLLNRNDFRLSGF